MKRFLLLTLWLLPPVTTTEAATFKTITITRIHALKKEPCVLMHAWAIWCSPCLKELPALLKLLDEMKGNVKGVVVDLSASLAHEQLSRKWVEPHLPSFALFKKAQAHDHEYLHAMDPKAQESLPFSVLYSRGKKLKSWNDTSVLGELKTAVQTLCK